MRPAREPASSRLEPYISLKSAPRILPVRHSLLALVRRKQTVVRDQFFPQKRPGSRLRFSRTGGFQHSPGSPTIELPSALAESSAYSPNTVEHCCALSGFPRSVPCLSLAATSRRAYELEFGRGAPGKHCPQPTMAPPRLNRPVESRRQPVGCISLG